MKQLFHSIIRHQFILMDFSYSEYHDFSTKSADWVESERQRQSTKKRRMYIVEKGTFPMKLFHMLVHLETAGYTNIASFQPHGRAIRIHDPRRFQTDVLPRYFPDNKNVGSFLRQLNIYGFRRMINVGPDRDSYYHAMFLRGRPDLCSILERPSKSQHSKRKKYDPMTEPNFYILPPIQLLPPECSYNSASFQPIEPSSAEGTEANSSQQESCDDDASARQISNHPLAVLPEFNIESHSMSFSDNNSISKASSFSSGLIPPIDHEANDSCQNNSIHFGTSLDAANIPFMPSRNILDTTIASDMYPRTTAIPVYDAACSSTSNNFGNNKTIPANVLAAAVSLLATQDEPRFSIDSTSSIVDLYCLNLATNILKESCYTESLPSNQKEAVQQSFVQDKSRTATHCQKADEIDVSIPPLSMKRPAIDSMVNRYVNSVGGNDVNTQHENNGSSSSNGFEIAQFLDHINVDNGSSSPHPS
jgi:HSF-type DNA-binding